MFNPVVNITDVFWVLNIDGFSESLANSGLGIG